MKKLENNWFADGIIDFEYKKYLLLAYLQSVEKNFMHSRLYPDLGELVLHYNNLSVFLKNKNAASDAFPKELKGFDPVKFILTYEQTVKDDRMMDEIMKIVDFSLPTLQKHLDEGREIYDWIEGQMLLHQVGILPFQKEYGYLLLKNGTETESRVYTYRLSIFQQADESYRSISTHYVTSISSIDYHYAQTHIMRAEKLLVPPPVFAVESEFYFPVEETLLPIAKRALVRYLSQ